MSEKIENVDLHDEDNEVVEGAHDLKNAEAQSVASVAKAEDGVKKKSPARKGDKTKQDPAQKLTKTEDTEVDEESYDFSEDLNALVDSEATLSEEFKAKTAVIFETAIRSKLAEEVERLEDEYATRLDEELEATRSELVEKVDNYLNYVVENWMEENRVAVEAGLRTEIAENFMNGLKDLFVESYIDVPESKVDLVDELAEQVEELEAKLNESTASTLEMVSLVESLQRESIIREAARDLADTQVEKLTSLVESLDFEDEETFAMKVKTVKESYFKKEVSSKNEELTEEWSGEEEENVISDSMARYTQALGKFK